MRSPKVKAAGLSSHFMVELVSPCTTSLIVFENITVPGRGHSRTAEDAFSQSSCRSPVVRDAAIRNRQGQAGVGEARAAAYRIPHRPLSRRYADYFIEMVTPSTPASRAIPEPLSLSSIMTPALLPRLITPAPLTTAIPAFISE